MSETTARSVPSANPAVHAPAAPAEPAPAAAASETVPISADTEAAPVAVEPEAEPVAAEPAAPPVTIATHGPLARHWNTLGIPPTTDLDKLETAFYLMVEKFSNNPTEEEERHRLELHRAYAVLRRSLQARGPAPVARRIERPGLTKRQWATASVAAAISVAGLLYFNFGSIKLAWVEFRPDTVVRLAGKSEPYATVVRFDPSHRFEVGGPGPAYQLKLAGSEQMIWLSERVVEKGMVPSK